MIQTYTGKLLDVTNITMDNIDIEDIAHALSNLCRFTGHCTRFYSVGEHSIHVSKHCDPSDALWGLLHDASEAYIQDISRNIKHLPELEGYRLLETKIMSRICLKYGLQSHMPASVKAADNRMLATEAAVLMKHGIYDKWGEPYVGKNIEYMKPFEAKRQFLARFNQLVTK